MSAPPIGGVSRPPHRGHARLAAANEARAARHQVRRTMFNLQGLRRGTTPDVRRSSYHAGGRELREWKRHNTFSAAVRHERVRQVRDWNAKQRKHGERSGPLSSCTIDVLDALMRFRDWTTGACFPSIRGLERAVNRSTATVVKALDELEATGLLGRLRRTRPIENPEPDGPQVEQITSAYWFLVPAWLAKALTRRFGSAPKPNDQVQREQDDAEQLAAMLASLSAEDLAAFHAGDASILAKALASFGRAHDREHGRRSTAILHCRNYQGREE